MVDPVFRKSRSRGAREPGCAGTPALCPPPLTQLLVLGRADHDRGWNGRRTVHRLDEKEHAIDIVEPFAVRSTSSGRPKDIVDPANARCGPSEHASDGMDSHDVLRADRRHAVGRSRAHPTFVMRSPPGGNGRRDPAFSAQLLRDDGGAHAAGMLGDLRARMPSRRKRAEIDLVARSPGLVVDAISGWPRDDPVGALSRSYIRRA